MIYPIYGGAHFSASIEGDKDLSFSGIFVKKETFLPQISIRIKFILFINISSVNFHLFEYNIFTYFTFYT